MRLNIVNAFSEEDEIVLSPPTALIEEAKEIAQNTTSDEKFAFVLQYDVGERDHLLSILNTVGTIVEKDGTDKNILTIKANMKQLSFIKRLNYVERVKSDKASTPFLAKSEAKHAWLFEATADTNVANTAQAMLRTQAEPFVAESTDPTANITATLDSGNDSIAIARVDASLNARCPSNANIANAETVSDESYTFGAIECPEGEQWFKFTATKTGQYTILTMSYVDTIGTLYDCYGNEIAEVDDRDLDGDLNFRITQNLTAGNTYYVKVRIYGDDTGSYTLRITDRVYVNYVTITPKTITLKQGELYELPLSPNYVYKGYNGAKRIPGLSVSIDPANASEQKVDWWEERGDVLDCFFGRDDDGDRYIHVRALTPGSEKLYARDWNENGIGDECTISVERADPFDPSNVEYVRIKKWRSMKTTNGLDYTECDMSTSVTKSYIDDLTYFTVFFPDEDQITTFEINYTLIDQLNDIESQYQSQFFKHGRPLCFHKGKEYADIFVSEGKIEYASPEYYGIWAYNGNAVCEINDRLSFAYALATIAYSGFMYGFTTVMSMQSMQMTSGQTKTYTNSQYIDAVESQKAIADISDDAAIQLGKTDISSTSTVRRTWRASEMKVAEYYPTSSGYEYNKSYKIVGGKLTTVPHGTAGSQRPDFYNPSTNHIVEVKNYTVTTSTGRNSLANNIAMQYNNRKTMFPDANIEFAVDVAGQSYTQSMLDEIIDLVSSLTGEDIVRFIYN